jgi:putative redox protein
MVTAVIEADHYKTEITATGKTIIADEPEEVGGTNFGPAPGEFLMISLASCTAITLRMYADRKQWSVKKIKVQVSFEKLANKTEFTREVFLEGDIDEMQRERLIQIANSCPVHKVLTSPITINTQLAI